jgi:uncharacterized protein YjbI with pentapeptide repeats
MANPGHLAKLKEGVKAWNMWREEDPAIMADLRGANLERVDLVESNLWEADLVEADLRNATLEGAHLWEASLERANFWGANLEGANLRDANLEGANLRGTDLRGTKYLSVGQLSGVETLYQAILDSELLEQIKEYCPRLLEKPEDEE